MHSEKGQATFELGSGQRRRASEEAGSWRGRDSEEAGSWRGRDSEEAGSWRGRASEEAGWGGLLHPSTCRTQVVTAFGAVEVVAAALMEVKL